MKESRVKFFKDKQYFSKKLAEIYVTLLFKHSDWLLRIVNQS